MKQRICYASALFLAAFSLPAEATTLFSTDAFITNFDVGQSSDDNKQGSPTAVTSHAQAGSATSDAISSGGHVGVATQYSGNVTPGGATANFTTEVFFTSTNPNISTTNVSLNLAIGGLLSVGGSANAAWTASAQIGSNAYSYGTDLDTSGGVNLNPVVRTLFFSSGGELISPSWSDLVEGILTTPTVSNVPLNVPIFIKIGLTVSGFGQPGRRKRRIFGKSRLPNWTGCV